MEEPPGSAESRWPRSFRYTTVARGLIIFAAFVSFVISVSLWFSGDELAGIFVGIWVPSILALGALLLGRGGTT